MSETIYLVMYHDRSSIIAFQKLSDAVKAVEDFVNDFGYSKQYDYTWYNHDESVLAEIYPVQIS